MRRCVVERRTTRPRSRQWLGGKPQRGREKKLYWYTPFGEIRVVEQLFWQEGHVIRPFCRAAGGRCRGYSQPLQHRVTDFGADVAFGQVPAKLKEHYGIEVPVSAVRIITEAQARQIHAQEHGQTPQPARAVAWVIAETDGSMIPIVDTAPAETGAAGGDRRKTRQVARGAVTEETAADMLALRTLRANGEWHQYWAPLEQLAA